MYRFVWLLLSMACLLAGPAAAQPTSFEHVVVIVQENRTPDNLFYALCASAPCSTKPNDTEYDIQTDNWLDKNSRKGFVHPQPGPLVNDYDMQHTHGAFSSMCDLNAKTAGRNETCRPASLPANSTYPTDTLAPSRARSSCSTIPASR